MVEYALIASLGVNVALACAVAVQSSRLIDEQARADMHRDMFFSLLDQSREYIRNSIQRDPKTGRYLKKGK